MAYPVTLVESNPVTDILHTGNFKVNVRAIYVGQDLKMTEESTYGRQFTFVFLTGWAKHGGLSDVRFHLQGRRQNTTTWDVVPGKIVELGSDNEYKIGIMYINDHQLRELGIEAAGVPFDRVRYWVSCSGGTAEATLSGVVYVVTSDLRFGLFGTNAQIASQMNDKGLDTTIVFPAEPWVYETPEVIK